MNLKVYETTMPLVSSEKEVTINQYAPFIFNINPFNSLPKLNSNEFNFTSKIYKIVYNWGDGIIETQKLLPSSYESPIFLNYPFNKETGDPRNFKKSHTYNLNEEFKKTIYVNISLYMFGVQNPIQYKFRINLKAPRLDGSKTGFFKNVHLIKTKMFDKDNKILYIFEGKEPSWVFPAIVDWRVKGGDSTIVRGDDYDVYKLNI
jgi:hypothetical protein